MKGRQDDQRQNHYLIYTEDDWKAKVEYGDPFVHNVMQSPKVMIIGGEDAL
jgi:hypothetical protein